MKLRFMPRATSDLIAIADYIRARNPAASLAVRDAILSTLQTLALYPEIVVHDRNGLAPSPPLGFISRPMHR